MPALAAARRRRTVISPTARTWCASHGRHGIIPAGLSGHNHALHDGGFCSTARCGHLHRRADGHEPTTDPVDHPYIRDTAGNRGDPTDRQRTNPRQAQQPAARRASQRREGRRASIHAGWQHRHLEPAYPRQPPATCPHSIAVGQREPIGTSGRPRHTGGGRQRHLQS